ncbi:hypothetical protein [Sphingomonas lacusdianchii]|uniref:hypothetical protein n=1 Tax=Sphingomonas lacusdianchii TaxID=2917992 RepID=UPI001F56162C|nr:hypothetical protein [Sphingomonas sp. JXJ CY 53]
MSADERCATCEWWQAGAPAQSTWESLPGQPEMFLGVCTVNPPVLIGADPNTAKPMFPRTHQNRRCGSWTEREGDDPDGGERAPTASVVNLADRKAA